MPTLSCPIPNDINPLQSNGFRFSVTKLPDLTYFCQEANIPQLILPAANFANPLSNVPIPGEKLEFGDLSIVFMIDSEMKNYMGIHDWMIGLGFPKSHDQYQALIRRNTNELNRNELQAGYSDATLAVLNNTNSVIRIIRYVDIFPTALQSVQFESTVTTTVYLMGIATFKYNYYEFV